MDWFNVALLFFREVQ